MSLREKTNSFQAEFEQICTLNSYVTSRKLRSQLKLLNFLNNSIQEIDKSDFEQDELELISLDRNIFKNSKKEVQLQ